MHTATEIQSKLKLIKTKYNSQFAITYQRDLCPGGKPTKFLSIYTEKRSVGIFQEIQVHSK